MHPRSGGGRGSGLGADGAELLGERGRGEVGFDLIVAFGLQLDLEIGEGGKFAGAGEDERSFEQIRWIHGRSIGAGAANA